MNLELASIKGPRASQEIAQQLRDAIYSGHLLPGDKLPSERELVRQFESSRVTVREAIRSLEMAGLLSVKRGYGGGAFVADIDLRPLKESFSTLLRLHKVTIAHLTEVRLLLEPHLAALAARRVTPQDLARLKEVLEEQTEAVGSGQLPHAYDLRFHRLVAEASGNPVLHAMMNSVADLLVDEVVSRLELSVAINRDILHFHRQIYRALIRRDSVRAQELMTQHVLDIQKQLWQLLPEAVAKPGSDGGKAGPSTRRENHGQHEKGH